jgi:hypothetical protein
MMRKLVRIKVKCEACRGGFVLSQEQYQFLIKRSQLSLKCPHCAHHFVYRATTVRAKGNASTSAQQRPVEVEASAGVDLLPLEPIVQAQPASPEFPPPPFAPLALGAAMPEKAVPPPFAALGAGPASPVGAAAPRQEAAAPAGSEAKKLTLNERFKRLPTWAQAVVAGLIVVILAAAILAIPTGGAEENPTGSTAARESKAPPAESKPEKREP